MNDESPNSPIRARFHHWIRRLRISRIAFFQLLLLVLALTALYVLGTRPWLDARALQHSRGTLLRAIAAFEDETASLDPVDYAPEEVPDTQNIAHWAIAGAAAVVDDGGFHEILSRFSDDPAGFDAEPTEIGSGLARNQPAISVLHRMAGLGRSDFGLAYERGAQLRLPALDQLFAAGSLLGLDAVAAATDRQLDDALRSLRSLDALTGAVAAEAPQQTYMLSIHLERLFDGTLRAVTQHALAASPDADLVGLLQVASQPPYSGGPCRRFQRMLLFDAAVRIAQGPDAALLASIRRQWLPKKSRSRAHLLWVDWARYALAGLSRTIETCEDTRALRGIPGPLHGAVWSNGNMPISEDEPSFVPSLQALQILQPEFHGFFEVARRARHQRLMSTVALMLLDTARRRAVAPSSVEDLPALLEDPVARELAHCVTVRISEGEISVLTPVQNDECKFWVDESLHWPLPVSPGKD